jgi:cytochrome oxidase assembly protein ShyY1
MWSLLRTRRWLGFTAVVIVAIVAFGALSSWQWQRADEERIARVKLQTEVQQQPQALSEALTQFSRPDGASTAPVDERDYQAVTFSGTFIDSETVLIRQRPLDGRNGFWVVTPMTIDSGEIVWVNRGWIPATQGARAEVSPPTAATGVIQVNGWLRPSETRRNDTDATPASDLPAGQVRWVDTAALDARAGLSTPAAYIEVTRMSPTEADVQVLPLPQIDETQNVSYAVQWLIFALVAISGWWYFLRREAREELPRSSGQDADHEENCV